MNSTERFFDIWKDNVLGNKDDLVIGLSQLEEEIRADERRKVIKEIGNECSDKDLKDNIDWCIQTLSLFDVTDLNKKELCETLETQKAMIVMHDAEVRADERKKFEKVISEIKGWLNSGNRGSCDYFIVDKIEETITEYEKEQKND